MPTAVKTPPTRRSAETTSAKKHAGVSSAAEARRLFENQLVHVSLRMPKTDTEMAEIEFEIPLQDLVASVLANGDVMKARVGSTASGAEPLSPTPRLLHAMANAEKIKRGRFVDADEMFDALAEASQG